MNRVDTKTQALSNIEVAVTYNYALWMCHYYGHMRFMETLHNVGEITDLSEAEVNKMVGVLDPLHSAEMEIGNVSP